jgi:signal transduction histidine kinase
LTLFVFLILIVSGVTTGLVYTLMLLLFRFHPLVIALTVNPYSLVITMLCICSVIGTILSGFLGKYYLRPLKQLIRATEQVKKGDFKVQVERQNNPNSEMGTLITSFNEMVRELDGIELFRNDFINNFSHEFKTPIVSIQGFAHQLQAGGLTTEEELEYIRIIAMESDRLAKMATNILLLSKLENQAIVTEQTEFWLDEQLRACLVVLEKQWGPKEIELNIDLDAIKYRFNEDMLSQIWLNLFSNAIKFTPKGGCISCSLKADEQAVTVVISDNGIGMDEDTRRHIFDKFYQGDTSHTGDGNGIGLTIVSRILVLCKGKINVESEVGRGSRFTVTLPVTVPTYTDVKEYTE